MVYFYNYKKKELEHERNLVKARAKAVRQLENVERGGVHFFKTKKSRNSYATVWKETYSNGEVAIFWMEYSRSKGSIDVPMYKNGKLMRK